MRSSLLCSIAILVSTLANAQAANYPNGSTVADFTVTDTHGQVHNLNAYGAQGKYVLLDFFFYNCGPCQSHAPYYSELYQTYGCNGGDLICIEIDNGTDTDVLTEAFSEDFAPGFSHPPAVGTGGGGDLTNTFGVTAFPTFCLISPARVMINQDIWPVSNMGTFVAAFPAGSDITPQACAVGITETGAPVFSNVFPNPTSGGITFDLGSTGNARLSVEVIDLVGHQVMRMDLGRTSSSASTRTLDLGSLSDGQYLLQLWNDGVRGEARRVTVAH
ncbi:MAG: T9SS type A sorting domain-containing protein [Flavobacteriales bacterium]